MPAGVFDDDQYEQVWDTCCEHNPDDPFQSGKSAKEKCEMDDKVYFLDEFDRSSINMDTRLGCQRVFRHARMAAYPCGLHAEIQKRRKLTHELMRRGTR